MTLHQAYRTPRRRLTLAALALASAMVALLVPAQAASAATYQFWGYYQLANGTWSFAQTGPAQTTPADGSVEGWRWAVSDESGNPPRMPRVMPSFQDVCAAVPAEAGKKRVAVVVDYGRAVDGDAATAPPNPTADCALVPPAATGAEVLAAVTTVRNDSGGLVCGIDSYPATGCGGSVATVSDEQKAADTPVTLATVATPQATPPTGGTTASAGATPGVVAGDAQTAGPVVAASTAAASSGVPIVVWIGLVILLLGAAALVWSAARRRQTSV